MFPLPIHIYFEVAAFLTSVITWYKLRHTKLRWFLPYLFFIVLVELTGRYIKKELNQNNAWLYNMSVPIEYLFYTFIFCIHYRTKWFRQLAEMFIIGFFLYASITFLAKGITGTFHSSFLLYGSLFMLLFGCLYFYEILNTDEKLILLKEPIFWVASGIFLFNAGEFFYNLFFNLLRENKLDNQLKLFSSINNKLIWVLFTCFSIAFIWISRRYKKA
jgi:hypothetical protein